MLKHRHIDKICIAVILLACVLTAGFMNGEKLGIRSASADPEYALRIFDDSRVHMVDIRIEDWEGFLRKKNMLNVTWRSMGRCFPLSGCGQKETIL